MIANGSKRQARAQAHGHLPRGQRAKARAHRVRRIEQEQHRLLALVDELLDVRTAGARRDLPVDESRVVAFDELAHFVKLEARAAEHRRVAAGHHALGEPRALHRDAAHLSERLFELVLLRFVHHRAEQEVTEEEVTSSR